MSAETQPAENKRKGPCAGFRVLELATSMVSGPFCGQILADWGADVIKIENTSGDMMRHVHPIKNGRSAQFLQFNRNKRSIALDLKNEADIDVARRLIAQADVVVENFRPGVATRLGLDYEAAKSLNPRVIYVSINGFGADGPYAKLPAYDQVIQALTGFMPIQGNQAAPEAIRSVVVDKITALSAASASVAALLERERGGAGQLVEVRMIDAFASIMLPDIMASRAFVGEPAAPLPAAGIYKPLRTADGHLLGLIAQQHQFVAICRALDRADLIDDARFATPAARFRAMDALLHELEKTTEKRTTAELIEVLWRDSEIAIAPVQTVDQFLSDPQVQHNGTVFDLPDGAGGSVRHIAPFSKLAGCDPSSFTLAPDLNAHGDEIRRELQNSAR